MAAPHLPSRAGDGRARTEAPPDQWRGDPTHAFGHLVSGVALYGLLGFGLDRLLGTTWLVAVGIVVGAVFGLYATWKRFMSPLPNPESRTDRTDRTDTPDQAGGRPT